MRTTTASMLLQTLLCCSVVADEGMWLFNALPVDSLQQKHNFQVDEQWARHLMLSSVRFNSGGSASFISSNGLVLTNHHVAADTLYKLSTAERNLAKEGYYAQAKSEELPAPDLELNQLVSIEDVTARVNQAVAPELNAAEASKARQAAMARIEQESKEATGLRSDVVTLYGGGRYHLYRYKRYTDVRLVWAPEAKAAFFGGDADNFEYPRYCLDVTIFRVYEDGQPANIKEFLEVNPQGAKADELVFVSGNPGRTQRILTADALAYQRDHRMPRILDLLRRKEILLQQYALGGAEQARRGQDELFGIQNSRKAYTGMLAGLQEPNFIARKREAEPKLQAAAGSDQAWQTIAQVQQARVDLQDRMASLRGGVYSIAESLVLMASEDQKPSPERLREYRDSNRQSLEQRLFSPAPLYEDLERAQLADEIARLVETRGGDDALVQEVLAGKGPRERASALIAGTKLFDVAARQQLASGGAEAIANSSDPLIQLARTLEAEYRQVRLATEELDERERQAYAKITEAKFQAEGEAVYPDATFTLRLAFGLVKGYEEDGQHIPSNTTMGGAFAHEAAHGKQDDWILPDSWHASKESIDLQTPMNFVCTADIIGGNSGSPVVDRQGRLVGVIFDGNIQSLTADFYHSELQGRAVAVHIAAVLEALQHIYGAEELRQQIGR
ncbi:MAG: S46 family peptidase [Planctomycetales bacterium]|nr:S46 family peptidase [Planctomycetales bacterium]